MMILFTLPVLVVHVINEPVFIVAIVEYMIQKLGIEEDKVQELCLELYKIYGTTMAGLKVSFSPPLFNICFFVFCFVVNAHAYCVCFFSFSFCRLWVMTLITTISIGTLKLSNLTIILSFFLLIVSYKA